MIKKGLRESSGFEVFDFSQRTLRVQRTISAAPPIPPLAAQMVASGRPHRTPWLYANKAAGFCLRPARRSEGPHEAAAKPLGRSSQ
jgi:hypothetical protein